MVRVQVIILLLLFVPLVAAVPTDITSRVEVTGQNELTGYCSASSNQNLVQYRYTWNKDGILYGANLSNQLPQGKEYALSKAVMSDLTPGTKIFFECQAYDTDSNTTIATSNAFQVTNNTVSQNVTDMPYSPALEQYCKSTMNGVVIKTADGSWKCVTNNPASNQDTSNSILDIGAIIWPKQPFLGLCIILTTLYLIITYLGEKTKNKARGKVGRNNDNDDGWY